LDIKEKYIKNMLTKKNLLYISAIGIIVSIGAVYLAYHTPMSVCRYNEMSLRCVSSLIFLMFAIFVPIFIFSIVTYKLKEKTFISWRNFTVGYLFIYLFLIVANPWMHADYSPFEKNTVFMTLVPLYFLISLILIIYKSIKLRGKS
jgi:hypothetical protein